MAGGLGNVFKVAELKKRILFTLGMLAVYRLGVFVPSPGINAKALANLFNNNEATNSLFGMANMFSGGALENFSIFTLGIMPYITMSILVQFLTPLIPQLQALKKEGAAGHRILTRYTRYGTMILALIQSFIIARGLEASNLLLAQAAGVQFYVTTMLTLTAGTAFIMWLGEQITERGIGDGMSVIIFAGIVARMPQAFYQTYQSASEGGTGVTWFSVLVMIAVTIAIVGCIVYVERSQRRIPLQYPRSERMMAKELGPQPYLPFKVNSAGVIPPIFASAMISLVMVALHFLNTHYEGAGWIDDISANISRGQVVYMVVFVALIFIFAYYYVSVITNPVEIAENLKKNGAFIPTVRPGKQTADYLYGILTRLTFWGAIYISLVCIVPDVVYRYLNLPQISYVFGGTAVLIAVGVTLDTASQIQSIMMASHYEAFMAKSASGKGIAGPFRGTRTRILRR